MHYWRICIRKNGFLASGFIYPEVSRIGSPFNAKLTLLPVLFYSILAKIPGIPQKLT
jgi:hypothetical protein